MKVKTKAKISISIDRNIDYIMNEFEKNSELITINEHVKFSFTVTFMVLLTTGTITFIEAIRTQNPMVRHILNLETCISIIASYFYSLFITKIENPDTDFIWNDITKTRYIDWSITTPLMLLTLCLVLGDNIRRPLHISFYALIIIMNFSMLSIGYLGEVNHWDKIVTSLMGFIPFFAMFGLIFVKFIMPKYRLDNYILYGLFLLLWGMYGIVYLFNEEYKNIGYNILDLLSKCFIGIGLWTYYTKIFV
jgi:bacteriorhodopsin